MKKDMRKSIMSAFVSFTDCDEMEEVNGYDVATVEGGLCAFSFRDDKGRWIGQTSFPIHRIKAITSTVTYED